MDGMSVDGNVHNGAGAQVVPSLAVLGTMSDAGKSTLVAGVCRVLLRGGIQPAPFKAQNMSNNAAPALLPQGGYGEIGLAQAVQAQACHLLPRVEMNPVLLKSGGRNEQGEYMCSVLVLGKQVARETYADLGERCRTSSLLDLARRAHADLVRATQAQAVIVEGAGSCTELNLMERDIVNLPLVRALQCPWLLVANIDCGGVFAQVVGTKACVAESDWDACVGIVVNKLRGEAKYFDPGPSMIEMVGKPVFVVPFLDDLNLPEEDGLGIERRLSKEARYPHDPIADVKTDKHVVVIVAYPHMAIADDLCPLENDTRFQVQWRRKCVPPSTWFPTAVVLPGSRMTCLDLKWLFETGWADYLRHHVAAGGVVLGLCGGFQMLGHVVRDPWKVEDSSGTPQQGLGFLPLETTLEPPEKKIVTPRQAILLSCNLHVRGFELHCGQSTALNDPDQQVKPLLQLDDDSMEGLTTDRVKGTYLHGVLQSPRARVELLLPDLPGNTKLPDQANDGVVVDPLDRLADHLVSCGLDGQTLNRMLAGDVSLNTCRDAT